MCSSDELRQSIRDLAEANSEEHKEFRTTMNAISAGHKELIRDISSIKKVMVDKKDVQLVDVKSENIKRINKYLYIIIAVFASLIVYFNGVSAHYQRERYQDEVRYAIERTKLYRKVEVLTAKLTTDETHVSIVDDSLSNTMDKLSYFYNIEWRQHLKGRKELGDSVKNNRIRIKKIEKKVGTY